MLSGNTLLYPRNLERTSERRIGNQLGSKTSVLSLTTTEMNRNSVG